MEGVVCVLWKGVGCGLWEGVVCVVEGVVCMVGKGGLCGGRRWFKACITRSLNCSGVSQLYRGVWWFVWWNGVGCVVGEGGLRGGRG